MTFTEWFQARFWAGIRILVARPGIEARLEKLIADYVEEALNAEIARLGGDQTVVPTGGDSGGSDTGE